MKLVFDNNFFTLDLTEDAVNCLYVESPPLLSDIMENLFARREGLPCKFILSKAEKQLNISKTAEIIANPFVLEYNNKKVINKLYSRLVSAAGQEMIQQTAGLNARIISYLDGLISYEPYDIVYEPEIDVSSLLKIFGVRIDPPARSAAERLSEYIALLHRLCGTQVFIICNLKQYLTRRELQEFYKFILYEKVFLTDIEGRYSYSLEKEKGLIIDKDLCLVYV